MLPWDLKTISQLNLLFIGGRFCKIVIYASFRTGTLLARIISPILPHLAAEFFQHLPFSDEDKKVIRCII